MEEKTLKYYIEKLTQLRRDNKNGGAPHKPIMILSVISNIEVGLIKNNKIFITPELVGVFKNLWSDLVVNSKSHCVFSLPFYHLRTEPFWSLVAKRGFENTVESKIAMKSFSNLDAAVECAKIDNELFNLLCKKEEREILKLVILEKYFPHSKNNFSKNTGTEYINSIEISMLNESSEKYGTKLKELEKEMKKDSFEEEKFVRGSIFKREIAKVYNNTCAISGLQISTTFNASLIDACHIVPFSNSYDDTISNGISLTPTVHRAFDRGLISIDENYKVIVSNKFMENGESEYSIQQFSNKHILLPKNSKFHPKLENLDWHRKNILR